MLITETNQTSNHLKNIKNQMLKISLISLAFAAVNGVLTYGLLKFFMPAAVILGSIVTGIFIIGCIYSTAKHAAQFGTVMVASLKS